MTHAEASDVIIFSIFFKKKENPIWREEERLISLGDV
jgi:hypothetical protein